MSKKTEQKDHNEPRKRGRPAKVKVAQPAAVPQQRHLNSDAPAQNYFVLCNGMPVKNVKELADLMDQLEDHVFNHHVRPDQNDFSKWVKEIFNDVELAEQMAGAKDKKHMQLVIYKHIAHKLW
ncbi:MAG: hypothetical protein V1866_04980 [archaeon]